MPPDTHRCPKGVDELAAAYVRGALPEAAAVDFEQDLLICSRCRAAVREAGRKVADGRAALMRKLLRRGVRSSEVSRILKEGG